MTDASCQTVITANDKSVNADLYHYPNPVRDVIHLSKRSDWILYNSLGQVIASGHNDIKIDVEKQKVGLYYLKTSGQSFKIIKE